jgi:hypothetical protein
VVLGAFLIARTRGPTVDESQSVRPNVARQALESGVDRSASCGPQTIRTRKEPPRPEKWATRANRLPGERRGNTHGATHPQRVVMLRPVLDESHPTVGLPTGGEPVRMRQLALRSQKKRERWPRSRRTQAPSPSDELAIRS